MIPTPRPVDPHWRCQRSGDCCTQPAEVVMTTREAAVLMRAAPDVAVEFRKERDGFVALKAQPCPFYADHRCTVYEVRPYACRRFGCMRLDVTAEPFEADGGNLRDRVQTSRVAWRLAKKMQRQAQPWARKMGWTDVEA